MPRRGHTPKREILADPLYGSKVVTKLINNIMLDGKKGVAQKIVYGAFEQIEAQTGKPALEVFETAMSDPSADRLWRSAGSRTSAAPVPRRRRKSVWRTRSWMPRTAPARP